ncbi:MFS transporter [Streptomyces sp. SID4919]|uniref:MFS transporter n=1 Tax=unclassified Streptomyces TaxID=2593676 RepID=UPI00082390E9|nr:MULTISPECIES: MFS transporter [unclassified Streptomyces]MYY10351.1 MFS transporter [Streptomyces sp. SID4919]SCK63376.1 Predicted arabinose efflux permease, MFS family [Streptomyces sp. AmelKG-E11A]
MAGNREAGDGEAAAPRYGADGGELACAPAPTPRGVIPLLAVAGGASVANVYFAQPLLVTIGRDLGMAPALVGAVVTLTHVGYGLGLFLLVPLGDMKDRRRLIVTQLVLLAAALTAVSVAPTAALLLVGMAAVGLLAVVTQTLVVHAASLAPPARRGRVVGQVTGGVVIGILLARAVSGLLADLAGWRSVYLASAGLTALLSLVLSRSLPRSHGGAAPPALDYGRLLRSTVDLFARERLLRVRALLGLLIFAAFSTLWSGVALPLSEAPHSLSHTAIGAFGLIGAVGALAAGAAGRLNDRGLSPWTTGAGLALLAVSWLPLAFTGSSLWALVVGVVVLDLAVQAVHVTNQTLIYALHPEAGGRLIGGYMIFYAIGSATGALATTSLYAAAGWGAVCVLGAGISVLAFLVWAHETRARPIPRERYGKSSPERVGR